MKLENLQYDITTPAAKKQILRFLIRFTLLFLAWHITYGQFLSPAGVIDRPLTNFISQSVVKCINFLNLSPFDLTWVEDHVNHRNFLIQNNNKVFSIFYSCDGINLMFTYVSILLLLPYPFKRKIAFSLCGIVAIIAANIIRCTALYLIYVYHNSTFNFSHHYLFTLLIDLLIFYGWLLFIKKKKIA